MSATFSSISMVVILHIYLLCLVHMTRSFNIPILGQAFPMMPSANMGPVDRPVLFTSRDAQGIPASINVIKIVDTALSAGASVVGNIISRPGLPEKLVNVRRSDHEQSPSGQAKPQGKSHEEENWSYDDASEMAVGPSRWHTRYAKCSGSLQSPIDIMGSTIKFRSIPPLAIFTRDGRGTTTVTIKNDGASVSVKPTRSNVIIGGGAIPGRFVLTNIHFHWGRSDLAGSEHRLGGKVYPLEMHVVTFNTRYRNMQEASGADDGIHVIGVLFETSLRPNSDLSFCTSKLSSVIEPGSETDGGSIDVSSLLPPPGTPIFRYRGSLTTPPCTENVLWSVYGTPQIISADQLEQFRRLTLGIKGHPYTGGNFRAALPLNNRVIFTNSRNFRYG